MNELEKGFAGAMAAAMLGSKITPAYLIAEDLIKESKRFLVVVDKARLMNKEESLKFLQSDEARKAQANLTFSALSWVLKDPVMGEMILNIKFESESILKSVDEAIKEIKTGILKEQKNDIP